MNFIKHFIPSVILFNFLFPLGGIGVSGLTVSENIDYIEIGDPLELSYTNDGGGLGGNFFIYFDALPMGFAIEYSKEIISTPLNVQMINGAESYDFGSGFPQAQLSDYFTIRKQMMELSIPILAKGALYLGGGFNKHKTVFPSIDLLKTIINNPNIDNANLISEFNTQKPSFTPSDFEDYFKDLSGAHIQAGLQFKVLMLSAFINARYTFITDNSSQVDRTGFSNILLGLAWGL
tara:strand:+ start:893 stop:1594 length:702 start_codon:yes stop_codon:yes gene_type:complete